MGTKSYVIEKLDEGIVVSENEGTSQEEHRGHTVLEEAQDMVSGPRQEAYGDPGVCMSRIADMWGAYLGNRLIGEITAEDACMMMVLLKAARSANAPKRDNLVDIAGYVRLAEMVSKGGG